MSAFLWLISGKLAYNTIFLLNEYIISRSCQSCHRKQTYCRIRQRQKLLLIAVCFRAPTGGWQDEQDLGFEPSKLITGPLPCTRRSLRPYSKAHLKMAIQENFLYTGHTWHDQKYSYTTLRDPEGDTHFLNKKLARPEQTFSTISLYGGWCRGCSATLRHCRISYPSSDRWKYRIAIYRCRSYHRQCSRQS